MTMSAHPFTLPAMPVGPLTDEWYPDPPDPNDCHHGYHLGFLCPDCARCEFCGEVPDDYGCRCAEIDARIYDRLERGE
jgi:hypothetical protein